MIEQTQPTPSISTQRSEHDAPTRPIAIPIHQPVLKVVGMGGGGSNAINRMIELGMSGVEFIAANTDRQALQNSLAPVKVQLGPKITRGLGAGGNPAIGQAAAEESYRELGAALMGADMVFLAAGMGGGTGSGSISVAARIAQALGAVTIAIVTTPFSFERGMRQRNANEALDRLRPHTDTLITIPNDRLLYVAPRSLPLEMAFRMADDVLRQSVQGITELITEPGLINVDFAHIRHVMKLGGGALMAIGQGQGENKALKAIDQALHHPLLESASANPGHLLENAAGILVNFTGGDDLTLLEIEAAVTHLQNHAGPQAEIVMGVINDERMDDRVQVILVVTGLGSPTLEDALSGVRAPQREARPSPAEAAAETVAAFANASPAESPIPSSSRLDIPAFLRRLR